MATKIIYDLECDEVGREYSNRFDLNLRMIARGTYYTRYVLMKTGKYGDGLNLDQVQGMDIIINEAYIEDDFAWHNDWWGVRIID